MNPPFSSNARTGGQSEMVGAGMVREALDMLAPGGRLVAIVSGGHPGYEDSVGMGFEGSQQMQAWWSSVIPVSYTHLRAHETLLSRMPSSA